MQLKQDVSRLGLAKFFPGLAVAVILGGCATSPHSERVERNGLYGARAFFFPECVVASGYGGLAAQGKPTEAPESLVGTLIGALAPSLIEKVVGFAASYAEARGKEYSSTATAATAVTLGSGSIRGCVIYVAGIFGDSQTPSEGWTSANLEKLGLARRPHVYAEWVLHSRDAENKVLSLTPVHLDFHTPQSIRTSGPGRKELSFIVEFTAPSNAAPKATLPIPFAAPAIPAQAASKPAAVSAPKDSPTKDEKAIASYVMTFGDVGVGSKFGFTALKGLTSPAQQVDKATYLNLMVSSVETEHGGDFLLNFSSYVKENSKTINDTLSAAAKKALGVTDAKK